MRRLLLTAFLLAFTLGEQLLTFSLDQNGRTNRSPTVAPPVVRVRRAMLDALRRGRWRFDLQWRRRQRTREPAAVDPVFQREV